MQTARDVLTPDALAMLQAIARTGSFAGAAREMGMVPSALTYRVRQIEDALDVLLFDRSARQARLTEAGGELLREGERLLAEIDAVANRVRRVATGWESQFTISVDTIIAKSTVMELCESFFALRPPASVCATKPCRAPWALTSARPTWLSASRPTAPAIRAFTANLWQRGLRAYASTPSPVGAGARAPPERR